MEMATAPPQQRWAAELGMVNSDWDFHYFHHHYLFEITRGRSEETDYAMAKITEEYSGADSSAIVLWEMGSGCLLSQRRKRRSSLLITMYHHIIMINP